MPRKSELQNNTYFLTGSTGSLGHATVAKLVAAGANVYTGYRNVQKFEAMYPEGSDIRRAVHPVMVDVSWPDSIRAAAAAIREALGDRPQLDALINNAGGIIRAPKDKAEVTPGSWLHSPTFIANCIGPLALARTLRKDGVQMRRIVNVSSSGPRFGMFRPSFTPGEPIPGPTGQYNCAKLGLEAGGLSLDIPDSTVINVVPSVVRGGFFTDEPPLMRAIGALGRSPQSGAEYIVHALTQPDMPNHATVEPRWHATVGEPTVNPKTLPYVQKHPEIPARIRGMVDTFMA